MPINVNETPEPLTSSRRDDPVLAECEAYHVVLHDILRYARRETLGRSVLISGHRGSGKTTLVRWAIHQAQKQLQGNRDASRPLLIPLHGPDLLGGEDVLAQTKVDGEKAGQEKGGGPDQNSKNVTPPGGNSATPENSAPKLANGPTPAPKQSSSEGEKESEYSVTRAALRMLTEALHRAYVGELSRSFSERISEMSDEVFAPARDFAQLLRTNFVPTAGSAAGHEGEMQAAQIIHKLNLHLEGDPSQVISGLIELADETHAIVGNWPIQSPGEEPGEEHVFALRTELLSLRNRLSQSIPKVREFFELNELAAQFQVAMDHAPDLDEMRFAWAKAGRLHVGILFDKFRRFDQGFRELVAASFVVDAYKRVAGKLDGVDGKVKQAELSEKAESKTDWSGKDFLNPLIGLLTGGLAGAGILAGGAGGLRPVFAALAALVTAVAGTAVLNFSSSRTRKTTRESKQTFTWDTSIATLDRMLPVMVERIVEAGIAPIFVVDELDKIPGIEKKMENLIHHLKHLVTEKTFFCFLADRSYFEHVTASSRDRAYGKEHTFFSERLYVHYLPADMHTYLGKTLKEQNADSNEKIDIQLLPLLLLNRAKMHPIDLRRAISDMTTKTGTETGIFDLAPGDIRTAGYNIAVFIQAAIEFILDDDDLRSRLRQDPIFTRLAYDALYMPSRCWEAGDRKVALSARAIRDELTRRMKAEDSSADISANISDPDLDLLHEATHRLAEFMRHPKDLGDQLSVRRGQGPLSAKYQKEPWTTLSQLQLETMSPLLGEPDQEEVAHFLVDAFGRKQDISAAKMLPPPVVAKAAVAAETARHLPGASLPLQTAQPAETTTPAVKSTGSLEPSKPVPTIDSVRPLMEKIRSLDQFVLKVTGNRLSLDSLASELRLLALSPPWPPVEVAMRKIDKNSGSESDLQIVESYCQMLNESEKSIFRSFILAALMTQVMPGRDRTWKLNRALRLLAEDLCFVKLDAFDRGKVLNHVFTGSVAESLAGGIKGDWTAGGYEDLLNSTTPLITVEVDKQEHRTRWLAFFVNRFRTGDSIFTPKFNDLRSRAAGQALPFKNDLKEMTYADYAGVLSVIGTSSDDRLLLIAVLCELGFVDEVTGALTKLTSIPIEGLDIVEAIKRNSRRLARPGKEILLFLQKPLTSQLTSGDGAILPVNAAGSVASRWSISDLHAALPIFGDQASSVLNSSFPFLKITKVLNEEKSFPEWTQSWYEKVPRFGISAAPPPDTLDEAVAATEIE